jgi:hypothetical protein
MNISDLNARSSLTKRQRRSLAPRVECLESREVLSYPATGVQHLINQALFHHKNTGAQTIALVNKSLTSELTTGALATLATPSPSAITLASAQTFVSSVDSEVATFQSSASTQLLPRFPNIYSAIFTYSNNIKTGVASQLTQFEDGFITNTVFWENVTWIVDHGGPGGPS